jgi:hypothetical protein
MLIESKSNLAKLMATENIIVEQKNVPTAYFKLKDRVLVVPTLKEEIGPSLYDLFMGHEVGHALFTPEQGWHDSVVEVGVNRSILNVCEDARIEKLICRKYPGLKQSFIKSYKDLLNRDFFGIKDLDVDLLKLIDRINLHTKCGLGAGASFTDEEMYYVNEVMKAETFEETVEIAKKIQAYMKEKVEEAKLKLGKESDEAGEGNELDEDGENEGQEMDIEGNADYQDHDQEKTQGQNKSVRDQQTDDGDDELDSDTDNKFRENEKELYDYKSADRVYANIPEFDHNKVIVGYKQMYKEIQEDDSRDYDSNFIRKQRIDTKKFVEFRNNTNKVVAYLAKEFELRKNADQLKRAKTSKTGELDMNKIFSYQFNEDIFKKITNIPNGKSHGLVLYLDWSASMTNVMDNTVKQLLTLAMFCKKVMIPFEVYAFSDRYAYYGSKEQPVHTFKDGDLVIKSDFRLLNILSSKMSSSEFTYAASALLHGIYNHHDFPNFCLGSTPLNEAIISAMTMVPEFQKKYKLQVVNTVFLTDGEGHHLVRIKDSSIDYGTRQEYNLIYRDPKTLAQMRDDNYNRVSNSKPFLYLLKQRTGCNVIGFRIVNLRDVRNVLWHTYKSGVDTTPIYNKFKKEKSMVITSAGFDEYYLLKSDKLDVDEEAELEVKSQTTRGLVSAFKKYSKGHIQNRVVLNRFVEMIA